jgi:hypothetical protein
MQAEIAVGVEFAVVPEHADLVVADKDNAAVAILEFGKSRDEFFGHKRHTSVTPWVSSYAPDWLQAVVYYGFLACPSRLRLNQARSMFLPQSNNARDGLKAIAAMRLPLPACGERA